MSVLGNTWAAYHLYYHESLDRAANSFVLPLVVKLFKEDRIVRFFFVRYKLGGPHIRLRLQVVPGNLQQVEMEVRHQAQRFLTLQPSCESLAPEILLETTRSLIATDSSESDETIYPDNTLLAAHFHPEIERYGGPGLIGYSIDFFATSSVGALIFLSRNRDTPRALHLGAALRLLLRQALSFAADESELIALLGYGQGNLASFSPEIAAKADQVFEKSPEKFHALFSEEILALENPSPCDTSELSLIGNAALALSQTLPKEDGLHLRVGIAQLHMTANRLGLFKSEEIYLARILTRASQEVLSADSSLSKDLQGVLRLRACRPPSFTIFNHALTRQALDELRS